jgi:hypothetical protein
LSAAAATFAPSGVRNYCKTPISYFLRLLEFCNYTELKVFGCILVNTVGQTTPATWCEIQDSSFDEATGVTKEWWSEALDALRGKWSAGVNTALIRTRSSPTTGRREYALTENLEPEIKALTIRGKCGNCKTIGSFGTEYVGVPHVVFRKLGACLDHASFVCLMFIIRHSLKNNRERGVWGEPVQLELEEFERVLGLSRRMVTEALSLLCDDDGWALVERTERPGRPAIYRARPENFGRVGRREARVVVMPENRAKGHRSTTDPGLHENPQKTQETHAIESDARVYGFCRNCGHYGAVEQLEPLESPPPPPERPPRPPSPAAKPRKKERVNALAERFRAKYGEN